LLSPKLAQLNRDAFVVDEAETTVRLDEHRGNFDLGDSDLGAEDGNAAYRASSSASRPPRGRGGPLGHRYHERKENGRKWHSFFVP
jgi:hypothetical protein